MSQKKRYSREFKEEAVRLAENSDNKSQIARDLGVHVSVLGRWRRELLAEGKKAFPGNGKPRDEEMAQLKRENSRLKQEVEILKKAVGGSRAVSSVYAPRKIPVHLGAKRSVSNFSTVSSNAGISEWLLYLAEATGE